MSEHLREEKQQREKLQREKDELAASKYGLEQEIKVCISPFSLTQRWVPLYSHFQNVYLFTTVCCIVDHYLYGLT